MLPDLLADGLDAALDTLRHPDGVDGRLAALCAIVEYWHGPILPEDGLSEGDMAGLPLPKPLAWWYRWAGRRTSIMSGQNILFSPRDEANPYWQLAVEDGFLHFHTENQGVYDWRTFPEGEDPQVFGRFSHETDWTPEVVTLSEHLILNAILEAVICHAEYRACSAGLDEARFATIAARVPALTIGPWRWCETQFYAGSGVFMTASPVGQEGGRRFYSVWLGAKCAGKLDFIRPLVDDDWEMAEF